ncbi:sigma-54-dependent Fis family transcriptional regulator [Desulfofundulus thermocisternus]|uniref:sigma-54-dependent Fis family transcriptional regulator n=1 Tax=Desulfofundulus thermocisternus TaxID=42471 RepID=UPI0004850317|nr:sigma-54-dependent Fis family transcriptional regulator [Desulfofundulus thermocisternus]
MLIRDFMAREPICLRPDDNVQHAAKIFSKYEIDGAPVVDETGKLAGIFTKTHVMRAIAGGMPVDTPVRHLMRRQVYTIFEDDVPESAWEMALKYGIGRVPVVDRQNRLVGMMTRTRLVQAFEQKYKNIISFLNAVLNCALSGICAVDGKGMVVIFNRSAARITGLSVEQVVGRHVEEVIPQSGLLKVLQTGRASYGQKIVLHGATVIANQAPVIYEDRIIGAVSLFHDVSEVEALSQQLETVKRMAQELDTIINASSEGIALFDQAGRVLKLNRTYEQVEGVNGEEIQGLGAKELVQKGYLSFLAVLAALEKKGAASVIEHLRTGREVLTTATPIVDEQSGNIRRIVVNCRDLTELAELRRRLEEERARYHAELESLRWEARGAERLVAESSSMRDVLAVAERVAPFDSNVLILGESGTGKDLLARFIHHRSTRAAGPFIAVDCAAIPENLLESELFGYTAGAFTGAGRQGKPGLIEMADGGTLFLNEIGELSPGLQAKLLTVIQDKQVRRLGGVKSCPVNFRLIAATNRDLEQMVARGTFRRDLFYRINVIPIRIPPLRERSEDIIPLVHHFLHRFNKKFNVFRRLAPETLELLQHYSWPGNVRELENVMERLVVISVDEVIGPDSLPEQIRRTALSVLVKKGCPEPALLINLYRQLGSTRKVAAALGVNQSTVVRWLKKHGYNLSASRS